MAKRPMNAMIEPGLLDRIDADRKAKGQTRSEWLARAAEFSLASASLLADDPATAEQPHRETVRKPADPAQVIADNLARTGPAFEKVAAVRKALGDVQPIPKGKNR